MIRISNAQPPPPPPPDGGGGGSPPPPPGPGPSPPGPSSPDGPSPPPPPPDGPGPTDTQVSPDQPDGPAPPPGPGPSPPPGSTPPPPPPPEPSPPPTKDPDAVALENCLEPEEILTTFLSVDAIGDPRVIMESDLSILSNTFLSTYNTLGQFNCDGLFRRVESVDIQIYDFETEGRIPRNINLVFRVEYSCRGENCIKDDDLKEAVLFSQQDGFLGRGDKDSKKKDGDGDGGGGGSQQGSDGGSGGGGGDGGGGGGRMLQDDECGVCDTDNPSRRSPSPRQFVDAYRDAVKAFNLVAVESITNILEIEEQACPATGEQFNETVFFELEGDPDTLTEDEVLLLAETFLSSYNYFSDVGCDGRFLSVQSVEIELTPIDVTEGSSTRRGRDLQFFSTSFFFFLQGLITGYCIFCDSDFSLVADDAGRRLNQELEQHGLRGSFVTESQLQRRLADSRRRTAQQFLLPGVSMENYIESMEADCQSCPDDDAPSNPPSVVASNPPSVVASSSPSRTLPGTMIFEADDCFCAKAEPGFEGQTVGLSDTVNTTFVEEQDDGRLNNLKNFKGVQFGMMGGRRNRGRTLGSFR